VPYHLKARLYDLSEKSKINLSAYVATRLYKYVQGELLDAEKANEYQNQINELHSKWESEANLHQQAIKDLEELKTKKNELEKQLKEAKSNDRSELEKQVKEKDKEIKRLNKRVEEVSKQRDGAKQKHKDEVEELKDELSDRDGINSALEEKINELEQEKNNALRRLENANQWIKDNTGGFLGLDDPGRF
jgi:chromosome segregation ATPase